MAISVIEIKKYVNVMSSQILENNSFGVPVWYLFHIIVPPDTKAGNYFHFASIWGIVFKLYNSKVFSKITEPFETKISHNVHGMVFYNVYI